MPSNIFSAFFAPQGAFPPCGMFTPSHLIATTISLFAVTVLLFFSLKKINDSAEISFYRLFAIILTIFETIKITHSFINGQTHLDAWVPISYCSLFIYSLWMAGFGKGFIRDAGKAFITYGCPIAGPAFLVFPTTSLMNYPIWHYLSLYSMFFHTLMLFFGLVSLCKTKRLAVKPYVSYIIFIVLFAIPAITLNVTKNSNLMNLREPYNIPIRFIQNVYQNSEVMYTIMVLTAYILIPFLVGLISFKIKFSCKNNES